MGDERTKEGKNRSHLFNYAFWPPVLLFPLSFDPPGAFVPRWLMSHLLDAPVPRWLMFHLLDALVPRWSSPWYTRSFLSRDPHLLTVSTFRMGCPSASLPIGDSGPTPHSLRCRRNVSQCSVPTITIPYFYSSLLCAMNVHRIIYSDYHALSNIFNKRDSTKARIITWLDRLSKFDLKEAHRLSRN